MTQHTRDNWRIVFLLFALGNLLNGAWMLVDPAGWYHNLPAAVPDFGPLNTHFVRDIGAAFLMMATALFSAAVYRPWRVPALACTSLFYILHALVHTADTLQGRVDASHWLIDTPGVYLPALLLVGVGVVLIRTEARAR